MIKFGPFLMSLSILFVGSGCAHKFLLSVDDQVTVENVVRVTGTLLVDKERKFNVKTSIHNLSDQGILIRLSDIACYKGEHQGVVQHSFFGIGERYMDFAAHQTKNFNLLCYFGGADIPYGPDYRFVIRSIHSNPSGDGRTAGDEIAKNITWDIKYREE